MEKTPVSLETHLQKYEVLRNILDNEIEKRSRQREPGVKILRTVRKKVIELQKEAPKIARRKRLMTEAQKRSSGFLKECEITDELRKFMKLSPDEYPSRIDITNAICAYIHIKPDEKRENILRWKHLNKVDRNLQDPINKRIIVPDKKLSSLLKYKQYKKDVRSGKIIKSVKDKTTGKVDERIVIDDSLYYSVVQKLIQSPIIRTRS
jgi:hypothetical protein